MTLTVEESEALRESVRASVEKFGDAERVARDIGAADLLADDLPALSIFFEEFGRLGLANSLVDVVVRDALGLAIADGLGFVYPVPRRAQALVAAANEEINGLVVDGLLRAPKDEPPSDVMVVTARGGAAVVPIADLAKARPGGFDPAGGWLTVQGDVSAEHVRNVRSEKVARAIAVARLSLGSEMLGIASRINAIAIDHVSSRRQFGKALGSFQTVRHRLAETHVAIQAARSVLTLGWSRAGGSAGDETDPADLGTYAKAAKALAGKAVETATRHANQVCGGMGLTWEHPLPALVRRGSVLNVLLGSPIDLAAEIGRSLTAGVVLPVPDPLIAGGVPEMAP